MGGYYYDYAYGQSAIALDPRDASVIVAGVTGSYDFPATPFAYDRSCGSDGACNYDGDAAFYDAFIAHFTLDASSLVYSTYLGGSRGEWGNAVAVDAAGYAYLTGIVWSTDYPTTDDAFDIVHSGGVSEGGKDAFLAVFAPDGRDLVYSTYLGGSGDDGGDGLALDPLNGSAVLVGSTDSDDFPTTADAIDASLNGEGDIFVTRLAAGRYSISGRVADINNNPVSAVTVSNGIGQTVMTDALGRYVFVGLPMAEYTLTPSKGGHGFVPATYEVRVPPIGNGRDFTILPAPVSVTLEPGVAATLGYTDTQGLRTQLDFSADAVDQATDLLLEPALTPGGAGFTFAGHAFHLEAFQDGIPQPGFTFGAPVTITIHYHEDDVRLVSDESQLALWWRSESGWQDAAQTCGPASAYIRDVEQNVLRVPVCHLSLFGLFGPTNQVFLPLILRTLP